MADLSKGFFNGRPAILAARAAGPRHALVGLEIEGNLPAEGAIVYRGKSREVGLVTSAIWSPMLKRSIAIASLERPDGTGALWVEIFARRELSYHRLMRRARVVARPFLRLARARATPPGDF
ncbi:MAG TPA: glycine cleavage T C-terminal barrel domain-containing protein [Paracoccaceae bacterium]|nr:glycine cleavage T C-terminal barrel domain-containing protein [Paracoccaceae bacterium]